MTLELGQVTYSHYPPHILPPPSPHHSYWHMYTLDEVKKNFNQFMGITRNSCNIGIHVLFLSSSQEKRVVTPSVNIYLLRLRQ